MWIIEATQKLRFRHFLPTHIEFCAPHQHEWEVRLQLKKKTLGPNGISIDFVKLSKILKDILAPLQDNDLNSIPFFKNSPTAERIALYVRSKLPSSLKLAEISVGDEGGRVYYRLPR